MKYFFLCCALFIIMSCKQKATDSGELLEVGAIKDVKVFGATFKPEEIKLGTVKICLYNSRVRCFSGALISTEGHIITIGHEFHEILGGTMYRGEGHPRQKFVAKKFRIIPGFDGTEENPIIPPEFEFDILAFHRPVRSLDFTLLKIKTSQLTEFNEWSFPLEIDLTFGTKNIDYQRVFLAGYVWPHLSLNDLSTASASPIDTTIPKNRQQRHPTNFGFSMSTGIIKNYDSNPAKLLASRTTDFETEDYPSVSASKGSSGGPLLDKNGVVIGIQSKASYSSVHKGDLENSKTYGNIFTRLDKVDAMFELNKISGLQTRGQSSDEERSKALAKVKILTSQKSKELREKTANVLKRLGTNRSFNIKIPQEHKTWCRVVGYDQGPSTLWIHKIEIEILSANKSRLRYFSKERIPPKNFWEFWKTGTWSPWFDFHTARLLTDYRIKPNYDERVPVVGGQGVYPYLVSPEKFSLFKIHPDAGGGFFDYYPQLLESVIGGLIPNTSQTGKPRDYWTVSLCE